METTVNITFSINDVVEKAMRRLAVIGKRTADRQGNSQFAEITVSTAERPLLEDYAKMGTHSLISAIAEMLEGNSGLSLDASENEDNVTLAIRRTRWQKQQNTGIPPSFADLCVEYVVAYVCYEYLSLTRTDLAKIHADTMARLEADIKLQLHHKVEADPSEVDFAEVTGIADDQQDYEGRINVPLHQFLEWAEQYYDAGILTKDQADELYAAITVIDQISAIASNAKTAANSAINKAEQAEQAVTDAVQSKVDKVEGKGLSTNDYTTEEKTKLEGIAAGAEANVNADWNATSGDAAILNKPTIPAAQIQSDWNQANSDAIDYIKNKPTIPAAQMQADWNQADTESVDYIKNKPSLGNLADKGHANRMLVIDGISDSITNFGTGYPPSGVTVSGIYYSKSNKRIFAKGSNNNYYAKWNEATVENYLRPSFEYYSYNSLAVGGIYHNLADGYNYYIKYNVSTPVKLPGFNDLPERPTQSDFLGNSWLMRYTREGDNNNVYTILPGDYNIINLDDEGVNSDISLHLSWEIGNFTPEELADYYLGTTISAPEAIVEIRTSSSSNTTVTVVDSDGNTLQWLTPAIGVLDSNSTYLLSIVDGTAGMIKLEERTTA